MRIDLSKGGKMKVVIRNIEMWNNHKAEIEKMIGDGVYVNLSYEKAHKAKTKEQMGFIFAALMNQCRDFFETCGYNVDDKDVRYYFYEKVSEFMPEIVSDCGLFGKKQRVKHLDEYDRATMAKFIDGCFQVLDSDPLFAGIELSPDTFYNFVFHLSMDDIRLAQESVLDERDSEYLEYVRTRPCIICGIQHRSEAHHLKDMRLCGMSQKSPDWAAMPLCHKCHMNIAHGTGFKERMSWLPIDIIDFLRLCYLRWLARIG